MGGEVVCRTCGRGPTEARLQICAMCHSRFCPDHSYRRGGTDAPPTSPWAEDDEP